MALKNRNVAQKCGKVKGETGKQSLRGSVDRKTKERTKIREKLIIGQNPSFLPGKWEEQRNSETANNTRQLGKKKKKA